MHHNAWIETVATLIMEEWEQLAAMDDTVPVGISARHVHLSHRDLELLFGKGYQLTHLKPLSQPGQFAAKEFVELQGPKGSIQKVRVLGPQRAETQVEISASDARRLGISPPVRSSGKLAGTPGLTLRTPHGQVELACGVIIPDRHLHMTPYDALFFGVEDGEQVEAVVPGDKGGVLANVTVRVSEAYSLDLHVDVDDANALQLSQGQRLAVRRTTGRERK